MMVWHGECSQGKDKWESCMALLDKGAGEHYNTEVRKGTFPISRADN